MDISSREDDMNMLAVSSVVNQRCETGEREGLAVRTLSSRMTKTETICTPGRINVNGSCGPPPLLPPSIVFLSTESLLERLEIMN